MLGIVLLYVGIVLINNGMTRIYNVDEKSASIMNIFIGLLAVIIDVIFVIQGDYFAAGTGLLFAFTYLFTGINGIFDLDKRPYGWYSLFVAINAISCALLSLSDGDLRFFIIWILWGILWSTTFIEIILKKNLGKLVSYLAIFEGIFTAWIPGFLMLINNGS
ncbi:AmiS/UreI family transporter [Clostridium sp. CCUG 7971]|uniref:AmiS/UreI family transporter n=1 Tax=Clostridium sp. CCUG 7971 TaxID=2811414 RepID=UPI001ABB36CD|nr:AmiS/UreI family transporter [Clostridium sp. CCUG 7971]MBO3443312.1 AmiS/UreI family transporter [Clostridium sp. CCUG 7971]